MQTLELICNTKYSKLSRLSAAASHQFYVQSKLAGWHPATLKVKGTTANMQRESGFILRRKPERPNFCQHLVAPAPHQYSVPNSTISAARAHPHGH